jgi:hypothetical protein
VAALPDRFLLVPPVLQAVLKEVSDSNGKIVLFIDEIHTVVGAGATGGAMDAGTRGSVFSTRLLLCACALAVVNNSSDGCFACAACKLPRISLPCCLLHCLFVFGSLSCCPRSCEPCELSLGLLSTCSAAVCAAAGNLLKPQLARGELRCIGATTLDEYRKYIEKDPALERRFQQVCYLLKVT